MTLTKLTINAMPLKLITVSCLQDNYAFIVYNPETLETALIDAPEASPIEAALDKLELELNWILITHHHNDHIDGVNKLRLNGAKVVGSSADAHRLPDLDHSVSANDTLKICGEKCEIYGADGHTVGHIAFHFPESKILCTADSLMALGCGRLFEGTPAQMWDTMQRFRDLPDETIICSGHEYTLSNGAFAATIEPENAELLARIDEVKNKREKGLPTVPSFLSVEKDTNPYFRVDKPELKTAIGMKDATDLEVFTEIRRRKDNF